MKRLKKIIISLLSLTLLMSVTAFAATSSDLAEQIKGTMLKANVPSNYVELAISCLKSADVTEEKVNSAIESAKLAKEAYKSNDQSGMVYYAKAAAGVFNYTLEELPGNKVQVKDQNGVVVLSDTVDSLKNLTTNVDTTVLAEAKELMKDYVAAVEEEKNPSTDDTTDGGTTNGGTTNGGTTNGGTTNGGTTTKPTVNATPMKDTATNNGNLVVAGLGLMLVAGSVYVVSRKVTA